LLPRLLTSYFINPAGFSYIYFVDDTLFEEPIRSHEEKITDLIQDDFFPVAVYNRDILLDKIGEWVPIAGVNIHDAVRLIKIHNTVLSRYTDIESHIWVRPHFNGYRNAWKKAGLKIPASGSRQLDHLHAKNWAHKQGYGYVLLLDVSSGPNMSAGTREKIQILNAEKKFSINNPVFYANEIHWAKLWDLNQLKPGELTKETMGK